MKRYELVEGNTHLKIEVYYHKGGMNYFTYKQEARGYWLSVCPVELAKGNGHTMETYTAFSGSKLLMKEVKRKSDKAYTEALQLAAEKEQMLIERVLERHGLKRSEVQSDCMLETQAS